MYGESLVCEYETIDGIIKVNCRNCVFGSRLEDFDVCMATTIDKLSREKKGERIILTKDVEHEYDYAQTELLMEIAEARDKFVDERVFDPSKIGKECESHFPKGFFSNLKFMVVEMLRRDPIGAYVQIKRTIRLVKSMTKRADPKTGECYRVCLNEILLPMEGELRKTKLIKMVKDKLDGHAIGDRTLYREIFSPLARPTFMLTRYVSTPPEGGRPIDEYTIPENIRVQIFRVPGKVRHYYYVQPPEFGLSGKKRSIIGAARGRLMEYKPTRTEMIRPEKARETFLNMGRSAIREVIAARGIKLSEREVNEMASILARYTAGFGVLEVLLADEKLQDVYINSPIGLLPIYVQHDDFEECETNLMPTREDAEGWATRFRMLSGRPLDEGNPVLDTELLIPGGRARVAAITRTLSPEGIAYAFRRHRDRPWTYPLFMDVKFFNPLFSGLMSFLIDGSRSMLIAGGRSSGKTSLLASSIIEIMKKFRIVTLEDTLELPVLQLRNLGYNVERLKSRSVITRVEAEMPAEEALRAALRLGDSCLIVGEVRSLEAKALYEAMRIGALANVVAGTIHGESAYGVYDRVVNDLGVPPTSFKATDIIVICGMIRSADGLHRFRRVTEVTEMRKHWKEDPVEEGGFVNLMEYSAKEDKLKPTDTLLNGESFIINEIAKRVREWHGDWDAIWSNIELRGKIKETIVDFSKKLKRKDILEADWTSMSNEMFHMISEEVKRRTGTLDSKLIYEKWLDWFKGELKK